MTMRVSVFGLGYVGCVTASCLARAGHSVVGVDVNDQKVDMINDARSPIVEPGLGDLLADVVGAGRLRATSSSREAVEASDVALVCVGTPSRSNGQLDASALITAAREIGAALAGRPRPFTLVVRSTVLPGTTERRVRPAVLDAAGEEAGRALAIAVNPEFMREGSSLRDFAEPPLTLVGAADQPTAATLQELYQGVTAPFLHTSITTAEMTKYVANAFHALKVCFANEIGDACTALGADSQEVMDVFLRDHKLNVSEAYLRPGFAFGGSCLPKDVRALVWAAKNHDVNTPLLSSILPSNEGQIRSAIQSVLGTRKRRIGVVGLAFKSGTDDLRESPVVTLVEALIGKGCDVRVLDRNVRIARLMGANRRYIESEIPHIASLLCDDVEALVQHAEVLVIGGGGEDAQRALDAASDDTTIIDLTRRLVPPARAHMDPGDPELIGSARA
jgi:GDP-mannose 6-dehydrogenase